jgi:hypothetical protein
VLFLSAKPIKRYKMKRYLVKVLNGFIVLETNKILKVGDKIYNGVVYQVNLMAFTSMTP